MAIVLSLFVFFFFFQCYTFQLSVGINFVLTNLIYLELTLPTQFITLCNPFSLSQYQCSVLFGYPRHSYHFLLSFVCIMNNSKCVLSNICNKITGINVFLRVHRIIRSSDNMLKSSILAKYTILRFFFSISIFVFDLRWKLISCLKNILIMPKQNVTCLRCDFDFLIRYRAQL